jgi:hypothetical protein
LYKVKTCHMGGLSMLRMYTLCLVGILGVVLGASGCGGARAGGTFMAYWDPGNTASCANAGIMTVDLDLQDTYTQHDYHDTFNCAAGAGSSERLPTGDYSVILRAYDSYNQAVSESPVMVSSIYANRVTDLPLVYF